MAIDLPETIPTIISTLRRSNSARTIQKLKRNFKPQENSKCSFARTKAQRSDQCRHFLRKHPTKSFDVSEERVTTLNKECHSVENNRKGNVVECEQSLLGDSAKQADLSFIKSFDWNSKETEPREIPIPNWREVNSIREKCFPNRRSQSSGKLLISRSEIMKRRKRVFLLSCLGFVLICLAIFVRLFDPLETILNWALSLAPGTFALNLWLSPPVTVYVKIYIFNFTNPGDFLAGKEKLKVQQLGPYVYAEQLENTNPIFHSNGTLSYIPRRKVTHIPEMSVGNPKSVQVTVPNIPFLGLASMVSDSSVFTNLAFMTLSKYLGSEPFLNLTVHDYLWGYDDPLVKMANKIVSTKIPFSKFGLLDRMYDEGDNVITIRLSDNGLKMTDKGYLPQYSIDTWNGSPGLSTWGYKPENFQTEGPIRPEPHERCKLIRGASDGVIFPRNVSPKIVHQVFRKSFCRMIPLVFEKEGIAKNGIPAYWYKLPENVFDTPETNPAQACYCTPNSTCLPKGLSDITPCYYNIPAAVSFPHFLAGDPKLLEDVQGLSPNKEEHGTNIMLQPNLGMPMEFQTRIQTNIVMKKIRYNSRIAPLSDLTLPIVWIELEMDGLPTYITLLLYVIVFVAPGLLIAIVIICFVSGLCLLIYSTTNLLIAEGWLKLSSKVQGKYSSIQITPMINKSSIINIYQGRSQLCLPLT
ncbi:hypothetical protein RUM44_004482 [Polyplax serrata]|uniref:Scavenger receptor class B member 1 n=1 Tax=Polyplax serrata TaxID=468196 RepID=A0ABR1B311_POLSC